MGLRDIVKGNIRSAFEILDDLLDDATYTSVVYGAYDYEQDEKTKTETSFSIKYAPSKEQTEQRKTLFPKGPENNLDSTFILVNDLYFVDNSITPQMGDTITTLNDNFEYRVVRLEKLPIQAAYKFRLQVTK